jgi:hypothetical protein
MVKIISWVEECQQSRRNIKRTNMVRFENVLLKLDLEQYDIVLEIVEQRIELKPVDPNMVRFENVILKLDEEQYDIVLEIEDQRIELKPVDPLGIPICLRQENFTGCREEGSEIKINRGAHRPVFCSLYCQLIVIFFV